MDFKESSITQDLRDTARKFLAKELKPVIDQDEETETFRPEIIRGLGQLGLTGVSVPEEYGGAGLGYQEYAAVIEEIAAVSASYAVSVSVTGLPQGILLDGGTEAQKKKYIPRLAGGEAIGAFSLSEASSGSDAGSLRTSARREGSHYILDGTKLWTTQADSAETMVVMARTGGPGTKGVSAFLLEKGGFAVGKREKKMGLCASHTMEVILQDVRIPKENRIGEEGEGFKVAMNALNSGRITIAAVALGVARSAFEAAVAHSRLRHQFGKPIGEFQGVGFMLADMQVALEQARLLVAKSAWLKDQNQPFALAASMAKLAATDMCMKVTTDAVQILGGSGYTKEFPVERFMREAKVFQIFEGTNQIQRHIISRALAGEK